MVSKLIQHLILGALCALFIFVAEAVKAQLSQQQRQASSADINKFTAGLTAKQINSTNAPQLRRQGPNAIGGIGDWFISNGTLCAIISDLDHEGEFSPRGGSLVDLGFCGRADDYFTATYDLLQGSQRRPLLAQSITADTADAQASIIVHSSQDGALIETRYSLNLEQPSQLHIDKRVKPQAGEDFNFISTVHFNLHSLESFLFSTKNPKHSNGFQQEDFVERGISAIRSAARPADTLITISPPDADHGIAYGWRINNVKKLSDDKETAVPSFLLADEWSNAALFFTDDFYVGGFDSDGDNTALSWFELLQIPLLSLDEGEQLHSSETIYVGKRGEVAAITDQLFSERQTTDKQQLVVLNGQINEINSAIHINLDDGTPVTHVRPDADGKFQLSLPSGNYQVLARGSAYRSFEQSLVLDGGTQENANSHSQDINITLPPAAKLPLPQGQAMRLVFVPLSSDIKDAKPPHFTDTLTGFSVADDNGKRTKPAVNQIFLAGVAGDQTEVILAPGKYQVYATRGPEYSLEKTIVELNIGDNKPLNIQTPKHINPTPGFIAGDLHVHSGFSFDNVFAERERVRTFAAEHGEIMVSSEHDVAVDYQPIIDSMGLSSKISTIQAIETTSLLNSENNPYTNGHANFFPFKPSPNAYRGGALNHEDKRWREVLAHLRDEHPTALAQLNHPRRNLALSGETLPDDFEELIDNGQFLDHMGPAGHPFNPHKPLHSHPNNTLIEADPNTGVRDIDFDLLEVVNPGSNYIERTQAVRLDWLAFLKQGVRMVATANSDSHNASEQVAVPRNMVAVKNDSVTEFKLEQFLAALKLGNSYGTTGPMLEMTLGGQTMGSTFSGQRGELAVKITTAPWIDLSYIDIQINGEKVESHTLRQQASQNILLPLEFNKDSFVTIEVHGQAGEDYQAVYPGLVPYAFSNPVFVDFDSDGQWLPPGL